MKALRLLVTLVLWDQVVSGQSAECVGDQEVSSLLQQKVGRKQGMSEGEPDSPSTAKPPVEVQDEPTATSPAQSSEPKQLPKTVEIEAKAVSSPAQSSKLEKLKEAAEIEAKPISIHETSAVQNLTETSPLATNATAATWRDCLEYWKQYAQQLWQHAAHVVKPASNSSLSLLSTKAVQTVQSKSLVQSVALLLIMCTLAFALAGVWVCAREASHAPMKTPLKEAGPRGSQPVVSRNLGSVGQLPASRDTTRSRQSVPQRFSALSVPPSKQSLPPSSRPTLNAIAGTLCPDLVAPGGNETVLGLRIGFESGEYTIINAEHEPVLGISINGPNLELFEWSSRRNLASCATNAGGAKFQAAGGAMKAFLSREGGEHIVRGCGNYRILGHSLEGLVAMAECMVAITEVEGEICWLKAGPGVDAGLMLLAMVAIDRNTRTRRPNR